MNYSIKKKRKTKKSRRIDDPIWRATELIKILMRIKKIDISTACELTAELLRNPL